MRNLVSSAPTIGGDDEVDAGDGNNTIIAGVGIDDVDSLDGVDRVIGDNGNAIFNADGILIFITTSDFTIGSDDTIDVGRGDNVVLGGSAGDMITSGVDDDIILGDNGNAIFNAVGTLTFISSGVLVFNGPDPDRWRGYDRCWRW